MRPLLLALLALLPLAAEAGAPCGRTTFDGAPYTVCRIPAGADVRLFLNDADGMRLGGFSTVEEALGEEGLRLVLGMNAGMYHPDRSPVGLYVEDGVEAMRLITAAGPGNFGMKPNGVLCLRDGAARILTTEAFAADPPACDFATQSGPMLVTGGELHPRFIPGSDSLNVRNGAGVAPNGDLLLAISEVPVNFHAFARLFRDRYDVDDALYLDGRVSRLWIPSEGRRTGGLPLGPMIGLVEPGAASD